MSVNVLYKTSAKATGGRDGHAATLDGTLDVKLATPKELGGGGGAGNNPEQLFAAGYAACFIGAMKFVASQGGPKVPADAAVTSTVGIGCRKCRRWLWPGYRARSLATRGSARGCRGAGGEGPPSMPLFQRHTGQRRCSPDGRLSKNDPSQRGGSFAARRSFAPLGWRVFCAGTGIPSQVRASPGFASGDRRDVLACILTCAPAREAIAARPEHR